MLTWGCEFVCNDKLLVALSCGGENHRNALLSSVNAPPLGGIWSGLTASVTGAHLDRLSTDDSVDSPAKFPGFSRDQAGFHVDFPPRFSVVVLTSRDLDLVGQCDGHCMVVTIVYGMTNSDPIRGRHWDGVVVAVRSKLVWNRDDHLVSAAVTLFEGQGDGELHRLVGGVLHRPILSLEVSLNFLG